MRRTRLLTYLIALTTLLTGALVFTSPSANADTADLEILTEAWFGRAKGEDPQVIPPACPPEQIGNQLPIGCGPVSPGDFPAPQSKSTGHYVVASAGGTAGDDDGQGDTAWAAFEWDVFDYLGATAEKFVVKLHLGMDRCNQDRSLCENQGDTYHGHPSEKPPPVQACNIVEGWNGEAGSNPWGARPTVSKECVPGKLSANNRRLFEFDVTSLADKWLAGTGYGFVIRPGTADKNTGLEPFQITFSGYEDQGTDSPECTSVGVPVPGVPVIEHPNRDEACKTTDLAPEPVVEFAYTPAPEDDIDFDDDDGDIDEDLGGDLDEDIDEDLDPGDDVLEPEPDLDIIPTDVGSEDLPEDVDVAVSGEDELDGDVAAPVTRRRTRPISNTPFPWAVLLLLPLMAVAFWSTGTALGPIGDPVSSRRGGVSRVLAERQAAQRGSDLNPRNRA